MSYLKSLETHKKVKAKIYSMLILRFGGDLHFMQNEKKYTYIYLISFGINNF